MAVVLVATVTGDIKAMKKKNYRRGCLDVSMW